MSDMIVVPCARSRQAARRTEMTQYLPSTHPDHWLTREEAAALLGVSTRTIDRYRSQGTVGYFRGDLEGFAAAIRFWASDVFDIKDSREAADD